ncbi:MAG: arsenate reductase (azurin) small subunit [Acidobacteriota bacterium]
MKPTRSEASTKPREPVNDLTSHDLGACLSRRHFLLVGGAGAVTILLGELFPGRVSPQDEKRSSLFAAYPRKKIAQLSELVQDEPVEFLYPDEGPHSISLVVKLGRPAGGGTGPEQDVVAFNRLCTHQGGTLRNAYNAQYKVAGPCPLHLTTFDLTRHGMVVAGHATDNLPQVVLELEGDHIYAIGILGLIYGYSSNVSFVKRG